MLKKKIQLKKINPPPNVMPLLDEESSSSIRLKLNIFIRQVAKTKNSVNITMDGKVIAQLTTNKPAFKVPPLSITVTDAKKYWSELLNYVWITGARYVFKLQLIEDGPLVAVYLWRPECAIRNIYQEPWQQHREKYVTDSKTPIYQEDFDQLSCDIKNQVENIHEALDESIKKLNEKIGIAFASLTRRNGDVYATPEMGIEPLRSTDDFQCQFIKKIE